VRSGSPAVNAGPDTVTGDGLLLLTPQFQFDLPNCASSLCTRGMKLAILPGVGTNPASPIAPCQKILLAKVRFVRIDHRDHHPRTQKRCRKENHVLTLSTGSTDFEF
jgi:hypothetical protein